jgi:hypothetical protein
MEVAANTIFSPERVLRRDKVSLMNRSTIFIVPFFAGLPFVGSLAGIPCGFSLRRDLAIAVNPSAALSPSRNGFSVYRQFKIEQAACQIKEDNSITEFFSFRRVTAKRNFIVTYVQPDFLSFE